MRYFLSSLLFISAVTLFAQGNAPKNLQVLKPEEVRTAMGAAAMGLGVQCTECHAADRSSDEKPDKLIARKMFAMTAQINAGFPDGKAHVSCYTCHRGQKQPLMAPPAARTSYRLAVVAVEVRSLSKSYSLSGSQWARFRQALSPTGQSADTLWALRDVSFSVQRGEAFGIIGANGSGKSTLLQLIAGILRPTSGSVTVNGRLSALLELGSGFAADFTGRENVYLNASILGLPREEIDKRFDAIERFAEIGDFIDQPVRTYSTGMVLRLAFAVTAHVDPEILIVDEALAVGDIAFRQRCMHRIHDLRARGTTILFVSHESTDVKALCDRCLWLDGGVVRQEGEAEEVVGRYLAESLHRDAVSPIGQFSESVAVPETDPETMAGIEGRNRHGDGRAQLLDAGLYRASGAPVQSVSREDRLTLKVTFRIHAPVPAPIVGFLVRNNKGENILGVNTAAENYPVPGLEPNGTHTFEFHWSPRGISAGTYWISAGMADGNIETFRMCDFLDDVIEFTICGGTGSEGKGYFQLRCAKVEVHPAW